VLLAAAQPIAAAPLAVALLWLALPAAVDALLGGEPRRASAGDRSAPATTIVVAGKEPRDVVRTSAAIARDAGPVIVASLAGREHAELARALGVGHASGSTRDAAVLAALAQVRTPAAFVVHARVAVLGAAVERAAGLLDERIAWVCGRVATFNDDAVVPRPARTTADHARRRARAAGLPLWAEDATVLRTDAVQAMLAGLPSPRGELLPRLAAAGYTGADIDDELAAREAPGQPEDEADMRIGELQWELAEAAALVRGVRPARQRALAAALALRTLRIVPALCLLAAPLTLASVGDRPWRGAAPLLAAAAAAAIARGWWHARTLGRGWRPVAELFRFVHDIPASAIAAWTVVTGRRHRPRRLGPGGRGVLWAAAAATLLAVGSVLGGRDDTLTPTSVALLLATLVVLWGVAARQLTIRRSGRGAFRFPIRLAVTVDGAAAGETVDVGPRGVRVRGPGVDLARGDRRQVVVHFGPEVRLAAQARVVHAGTDGVAGLELELDDALAARWAVALFRAGGVLGPAAGDALAVPRAPVAVRPRTLRPALGDAAVVAVTMTVSMAAVVTLTGLALGYRPLVVRSGSMEPAIMTGDLIVTLQTPAHALAAGDIVTFSDPTRGGASVTHRVRSLRTAGGTVAVETRGDANELSERWEVPSGATVGRYVGRVPAAGHLLIALSSPEARLAILAFLVLAAAFGFAPRRLLVASGARSRAGHDRAEAVAAEAS
jgi:signal peptidase